jgi:hemerythrin
MSRIQWSDKYATGIKVIDGQHKRIIDYLNQLDAMDADSDKAAVREVLFHLLDYTLSHFAFEEALMDEAGYPAASIHQRTHDAFRKKIQEYQQRFAAGEKICEELITLLNNWLIDHIAEDDTSYVPYVRKHMPAINGEVQSSWLKHKIGEIFG